MSSSARRRVVLAVAVLAVVLVAGVLVASQWTPTIPAGAASTAIATTELIGEVDPDPARDSDPTDGILSPSGQQCLDRIVRNTGWMDVCWSVVRTADLDANKDYYTLRVYGTVSGAGGGIRWSRVRADFRGALADGVFDAWPAGTIDGPCRSLEFTLPLNPTGWSHEVVCGRTIGAQVSGAWAYTVDWTCVGCLIPDRSARPIAFYESVGVSQGTTPTWSIGADFGD